MKTKPLHESELPPVLFAEHLCALLGVSESTLRRARKRRNFPYTELPRIGRKPMWSRDQVLRIISTGRRS